MAIPASSELRILECSRAKSELNFIQAFEAAAIAKGLTFCGTPRLAAMLQVHYACAARQEAE